MKKIPLLTISEDLKYIFNIVQPSLETGPWIAGGAVLTWLSYRKLGNHDVDIFCQNSDQYNRILNKFEEIGKSQKKDDFTSITSDFEIDFTSSSGYWFQKFDSKNAATWSCFDPNSQSDDVRHNIQIIKSVKNSVQEMFDSFDIRVCKMATDGHRIISAPGAWEDFINKRITMSQPMKSHCVQRIVKYMCYGYEPDWDVMQSIIESDKYSEQATSDEYIQI